MTRARTLLWVVVTYLVAIAVGATWLVAGPDSGSPLLDAFIADVLATLVVFAVSTGLRNSSFYDVYWSVIPPVLVLWWWGTGDAGTPDLRAALLGLVMIVWAVRLTANWARTFPGHPHEDWRYELLRQRAPLPRFVVDLVAVHLVPTLQVFAALVPAYYATAVGTRAVGWLDWVATVVGLGAVWLSWQADRELYAFAQRRQPGEILSSGLWGWSRHPNYFGEFSFWVSLALFGLAAAPEVWWWQVLGALGILALLLGASIPMMEERSLARRPDYLAVIDSVPRFVPRPPRAAAVRQ